MSTTTITAADILTGARNCDWSSAARAYRALNDQGDGWDPEGEDLGARIGTEDGLTVYDDDGDAVIVGDAWAVRVYADEPITLRAW